MTNPDNSGMLRFLTDELQDAEDAGERGSSWFDYICVVSSLTWLCPSVWIVGHVPTGWDGTNALNNPTNLCMS